MARRKALAFLAKKLRYMDERYKWLKRVGVTYSRNVHKLTELVVQFINSRGGVSIQKRPII